MNIKYKSVIDALLKSESFMYKKCESEQQSLLEFEESTSSSISSEIDIVASTIIGYATQLMHFDEKNLHKTDDLIVQLEKASIFRKPSIINWISHPNNQFPFHLTYLQSIESLRVAMLIFLTEPINYLSKNVMSQELNLLIDHINLPPSIKWFEALKNIFGLILEDKDKDENHNLCLDQFSGCLPYKGNISYQYNFKLLTCSEIENYNIPNFKFNSIIKISSHGNKNFIAAANSIALLGKLCDGLIYNPTTKSFLDTEELLLSFPTKS